MPWLKIQIDTWEDDDQPGFVRCSFVDASGKRHVFIAKVPRVTTQNLRPDSGYPRQEFVECDVLRQVAGQDGRVIIRFKWIWSTENLTDFEIFSDQLFDEYHAAGESV